MSVLTLVVCIGCDQATKMVAAEHLKDASPIQMFVGMLTFTLTYIENRGSWGGLGSQWPEFARQAFLLWIPTLVMLVLGVWLTRTKLPRLETLGWSLLLAGGIGNLIDRALWGKVIDFLHIQVGPVGTNVFNVADIAIMAGVILLAILSLVRPTNTTDLPAN